MYGTAVHEQGFWADQLHALVLQLSLVEGEEARALRHEARNLLAVAIAVESIDLRNTAVEVANLQVRVAAFMTKVASST